MSKPFTLTVTGDLSMGDGYLSTEKRKPEKARLEKDPLSFLKGVESFVSKSDYLIVNLETVLEENPTPVFEDKKFPNWDHPERALQALKHLQVDAVTLANNHTLDFGEQVFKNTLNHLENGSISYVGGGSNIKEASKPVKITIQGEQSTKNVYVFNGMRATRKYRNEFQFLAKQDKPGIHSLNVSRLTRRIAAIREKDPGAFVIVIPHWAEADYKWMSRIAEDRSRRLIDAGADLILAHGTHMVNHIEKYENKYIAYSLGNFVFNAPGRYAKMDAPPYSLVANVEFVEKDGNWTMTPSFYPIVTDNKRTDFHVHFTSKEETEELFEILNSRQYIGEKEEVIKEKDGYYYLDPSPAKEKKVIHPSEIDQLLPEQNIKASDLDDPQVFENELKKLDTVQKKIDRYVKEYYRLFHSNDQLADNKEQLTKLSKVVKKEYLSHGFLKKFERKKIPMTDSLSFQDIMVERSTLRRLGHQDYAWELDRKTKAYRFADEIGLRRPESDSAIYTFEEIKGRKGPIVIKPVQSTGSTGVYLIYNDHTILSAKFGHYLSGWHEIEEEMREPLAAVHSGKPMGSLRKDEWIVEELILRDPASTAPPLDYKFYCFYGELLFVLEADRSDSSGFSVWNADGTLAKTGWQDEKLREGIGFSQADADEALRASLEVPAPFIRMDMLKSHDGIVFGEATPRPGRFHLFNKKYDRLLGKAYREAEARLQRDLLNGKEFAAFKKHFTIK